MQESAYPPPLFVRWRLALQFVWYDFETFGLDPQFDSIAQCAFVATDSHLQVESCLNLQVRPPADKLIHPFSLCVTGLSLHQLDSEGITEWQAAGQIHSWLLQRNGVLAGFNSASFDAILLRFLFFRNLLPAYKHEQNYQKADVLQWLRTIYALDPDGLRWDTKLGYLRLTQASFCGANGISADNAHDALADTNMMLELVRFLADKKPRVMQHFLFRHNPEYISQAFANPSLGLLIDKTRGWKKRFARPVVCGRIDRKNLVCLDIEATSQIVQLLEMHQQEFLSFGPKHLKYLKLNDCPIILPWQVITKDRAARLGYDTKAIDKQAATLSKLFPEIAKLVANRTFPQKSIEGIDVESQLYLQRDYFDQQTTIAWLRDKLQAGEILQEPERQQLPCWLKALYALAVFRETGTMLAPTGDILKTRLYGQHEPNYAGILQAHCHLAEAYRLDRKKQDLLQEAREHLDLVKSLCD